MIELISFTLLNVILARLLSKKLRVASIAHSVVYVIVGALLLFSLDNSFIREYLIKIVGEANYYLLNESLESKLQINSVSISSMLVVQESIYSAFAILVILFFVKFVRKLISRFCISYQFRLDVNEEEETYSLEEEQRKRKKIYLEKCSLLI